MKPGEIFSLFFSLLLIVGAHLFGWWALILIPTALLLYVGSGVITGAYMGLRDSRAFHRSHHRPYDHKKDGL